MTTTPHNTPTTSPDKDYPVLTTAGRMVRVGGGYSTNLLADKILNAQQHGAAHFRSMDPTAMNPVLQNHLAHAQREQLVASHSFLYDRRNIESIATAIYEQGTPFFNGGSTTKKKRNTTSTSSGHRRPSSSSSIVGGAEASSMMGGGVSPIHPRSSPQRQSVQNNVTGGGGGGRQRSTDCSSAAAARVKERTRTLLDRTVHTSDGSCCEFQNLPEHRRVNGLFVTFCEQSVHAQLQNARRELEGSKGARELDSDVHSQEMAALLAKNVSLTKQVDGVSGSLQLEKTARSNDVRDLTTLKLEYETRYHSVEEAQRRLQQQLLLSEQQLAKVSDERNSATLRMTLALEDVDRMQRTCRVTERQNVEMAQRCALTFEEKTSLQSANVGLSKEVEELKFALRTRDALITALQRELTKANDKMSAIEHLKENAGIILKTSKVLQR